MTFSFDPLAEAEHLEAIAFYEERRPGLGALYLEEFESAMQVVVSDPRRFRVVREPDIRRLLSKRFPFNIIYREHEGQVQVLAVAHHKRKTEYWAGRVAR